MHRRGLASAGARLVSVALLLGLAACGGGPMTGYTRWIDEQLQQPASVQLPTVQAAFATLTNSAPMIGSLNTDRQEIRFRNSRTGPDLLARDLGFLI